VKAIAYRAEVSLPSQFRAKPSRPIFVKKRFTAPKLGSYINNQIIPTDTEERIVGKKKRVRSAIFALEFLTRKSAKMREKSV